MQNAVVSAVFSLHIVVLCVWWSHTLFSMHRVGSVFSLLGDVLEGVGDIACCPVPEGHCMSHVSCEGLA